MAFAFSAAASPCYSCFSLSLGKPYGHVFSANTVEFPLNVKEESSREFPKFDDTFPAALILP